MTIHTHTRSDSTNRAFGWLPYRETFLFFPIFFRVVVASFCIDRQLYLSLFHTVTSIHQLVSYPYLIVVATGIRMSFRRQSQREWVDQKPPLPPQLSDAERSLLSAISAPTPVPETVSPVMPDVVSPPLPEIIPTASSPVDETRLSFQIIEEQQLIIKDLRAVVKATKERVTYLTDINRDLLKEQGGQQEAPPLMVEELAHLRVLSVKLTQQTFLLMEEKKKMETCLESSREAIRDLNAQIQRQQQTIQDFAHKEDQWKQQTALLRVSETERRKLQAENVGLREDLDLSSFEKKRWRALVQTLSCRLHPSLNVHIEKHIKDMVAEEETRFQASQRDRRQRQAALLGEPLFADMKDGCSSSRDCFSAAETTIPDSDLETLGGGRSINQILKVKPPSYTTTESTQGGSEDIRAVWHKNSPNSMASSSGSPLMGSPKGGLSTVAFQQPSPLAPSALPGSQGMGVFVEDPRYNFGPGTMPILNARSDAIRHGPKTTTTSSLSTILQPAERKSRQMESRKGRHLVPL